MLNISDYHSRLATSAVLNSLIKSNQLNNYLAIDENGNISITSLVYYKIADYEVGAHFINSWADSTDGILSYNCGDTLETYCTNVFKHFNIYEDEFTLDNLGEWSRGEVLLSIHKAIKRDVDLVSKISPFDEDSEYIKSLVIIELALYNWIKNCHDVNTDNDTSVTNDTYINNNVMFNYTDWKQTDSKTYTYKGSNPLFPKKIGPDDFNNNSLLDDCFDNLTSDAKAFYFRSKPTSDRKNGASKSFMFLKDGSAVYCVDSVTHKMRELSLSAAGGKDGIVSRPYYYISFPLAGKSRQLPLHKVLAVFAHAEELIAARNKLGVPLCGLVPNHKDNNGINNSIDNLEWVSPDENKLHSSAVELLAMADGGRFVYLVDKEHNTDVWVSAKDQWVIPNRNILNFKLSIQDIYRYLENNHITIAGHSIRAIVNIHDFINYLKSEGIIKEA